MRYRRLSYRYAVVMATARPRPFGEVWQGAPASIGMAQPSWRPATDVVETATEVIVLVELAGVDHEELDVLLFEDALIVEGERRLPPAHGAGVYHAAEIRQGQIRLELPLPASIDPEQVDARYERGILEMRLVKRNASRSAVSIPMSTVVDAAVADTPIPGPDTTDTTGSERQHGDPDRSERDDDGT
jgi:HSP20 family protein